jgi:cellulose synthase/poly-beta-1,6-N-acetylglucosamine synthase-like glycosyltransferase
MTARRTRPHSVNCITVVPGAVGAWRRELIERAGGFSRDTLAEDADLTLTILEQGLRRGRRIVYEPEAVARTEAPENLHAFVKQRFRWTFGTLQTAWKHRSVLFNPRYRALGLLALPSVVFLQLAASLIAPVLDLSVLGALFSLLPYRGLAFAFHGT